MCKIISIFNKNFYWGVFMKTRKMNFGTRLLTVLMSLLMVFTSIPALALVALADELSGVQIADEPRYELNFNKGWKFNYGDVSGAYSTAYSDKSWTSVSLPHDFSIIQDFTTSGTEGESGSLPGGTGWYRKSFILPENVKDRVFVLNFGASYQETTVYVNGTKIGENFNGYNSFSFDISDYLYFDGATQNVVAVKVVNNIPSSRWYSGSGLIGDVTLSVLRNVHVGLYGTQVTTPDLAASNGTDGTTKVNIEVHNDANASETVSIVADIRNASGNIVATTETKTITLSGNSKTTINLTAEVQNPALWSVDTPNLYTANVRIEENGEILDEYVTDFGYTWSSWSQTSGFSLNGQNLKLQGVCMHLDQGGLGSAQEYEAIYRQLSILKGMGVNAIRGAHNVFPEMYIDICNELGILFMQEMFDGWKTSKNGNTYDFGPYFNTAIASNNNVIGGTGLKWYQFVVKQTVLRDRNNPSVFVWDVGNELDDTGSTDIASDLKNIIDSLDERPILWGNNKGSKQPIDNYMDIFGGNYHLNDYLNNHSSYGMPFVGSETASALSSRGVYKYAYSNTANVSDDNYVHDANYAGGSDYQINAYDASRVTWGNTAADAWYYTIVNDWFSGEFIWTGFDYIGEPTPWNAFEGANSPYAYPNSSYFGPIDTAGFYKDTAWLYNALWNKNETTLHLVPGTWNRSNLVVDSSGYVDTAIYTNAPYVELLYNGTVIAKATGTTYTTSAGYTYTTYTETVVDSSKCKVGTLTDSNDHNLYPLFEVKYDASATLTLKAYQSEGGAEITDTAGTKKVYANSAAGITVAAWNNDTTLTADGDSFNYIEVTAVDANGNFVNDYNGKLSITLTSSSGAGIIAAVDNGNAATDKKFQSSKALLSDTSAEIQMFNGKALIIVQSTENTGKINVTVSPEDLPYKSIGLTSEAEKKDKLTDEFEEIFDQTVDVSKLDNQARYEFLKDAFNDFDAPVIEVTYELYTLGSGAVTTIPTGNYIIYGADTSGSASTGALGTTSAASGTLQTSGAAADTSSQVWYFNRNDNGKYTISFTGVNVTNEFLNINANGASVSLVPQELDVVLTNGTVKIGDGTNFITYSATSANTAGVSTSGTALKLYTVEGSEVKRFGNVGLLEDGQYVVFAVPDGQGSSKTGFVMSPEYTTVSGNTGFNAVEAQYDNNILKTNAENEITITNIDCSDNSYTIRLSTGKYYKIDTSTNGKVVESDTPFTVYASDGAVTGDNRIIIHSAKDSSGKAYLMNYFSGEKLFSQWNQTVNIASGDNELHRFFRRNDTTSAADIALYNAIEKALAENPAAYEEESFAALLDAVQEAIEMYGDDSVSDADKNAAVDAINTAFDALEKNAISPTLKEDIQSLDPNSVFESVYNKYTAVNGTPLPDGNYIIYNQGYVMTYENGTGTVTSGSVTGVKRASATPANNIIETSEDNELRFTLVSASANTYYIQNKNGEYLTLRSTNSDNKYLTYSTTPLALTVVVNADGTVALKNGTQMVDHFASESNAPLFSSWTGVSTAANKAHTLFREEFDTSSPKYALYQALINANGASQELYTNATYTALLLEMQKGYNVFVDDNATEADMIAATQAINNAYDSLKFINLRPLLSNQIANLTPPADAKAEYSRYTATLTNATIIPDGEYVISLDEANKATNGCWGVMSNTYVLDKGLFWNGMGRAATNAVPDINSDTWYIERDTSSGNYLIYHINSRGNNEYLSIPNENDNDNCEMGGTEGISGEAYWSAEIDSETGLVKFRNATRTDHLITFCGQEAYDSKLVTKSIPLYVSAYQESKSSGGRDLRLLRKENGNLVPWHGVSVEEGKYLITQGGNDWQQTNISTELIDITRVNGTGGFEELAATIENDRITTKIDYELNFDYIEGTVNQYYITNNAGQYLYIDKGMTSDSSHYSNALTFSSTPMAFYVEADSNNTNGTTYGNVYIYYKNGSTANDRIHVDHYIGQNRFSSWMESASQNKAMRLFRYESTVVATDNLKNQLYALLKNSIEIDQGNYSDESYNNLLVAIKNGVDAYNNETGYQAAIDAIDAAIAALEIAKASFPATIYKYGYTPTTDFSSGGLDFNEIAYREMFDIIYATPAILDQIKAVIGYDTSSWANADEKNSALEAVVYEYAKIYTLAFSGFGVASTETKVENIYATYWNVWEKPGTKAEGENNNEGASVQGLFSATLDENGLPATHSPYDNVLEYINTDKTDDPQNNDGGISGMHANATKQITRNGSSVSITLTPLEDISVYVPDFFSKNDIVSADKLGNPTETYAKRYWDVQFPFVEYTNMFGVNTYVYDSSDTDRVFQASYNDATHTATAQLTEVDDPSKGLVHIPYQMPDNKGFFPFNYRLDSSNANMATTENAVYHYGMSFTTEFYIPTNGHYGDGNDIVFEFSGDDDVLVYIDDVLVLDNGGLHGARYSYINFTQKSVTYQYLADVETSTVTNAYSEGITYTYGAENEGISARNQAALEYLHKIATDGEQHTFKFYYLERGSTESNCKIMFNIQKISDYVKLNDQSYVVDYGIPVEFDVKENNVVTAPEGYEFATYTYIGVTDRIPSSAHSLVMFTEPTESEVTRFRSSGNLEYAGNFGTYYINKDGTVKYAPQTMQFTDAGSIYLCAKVEHDPTYKNDTVYYAFEKITIIPATTIYYEDDFDGNGITYTDGTIPDGEVNTYNYGVWQEATNSLPTGVIKGEIYQNADQPGKESANNYGYDGAYDSCAQYSGYSANYVTVSTKNNPNASYSGGAGASWPKAEFTFAGTGFDLISVTSKDTGTINITVKNSENQQIRNHTVNTYYGYTYGQLFRSANGGETLVDTGKPLYFTADKGYTLTPTYYAADGSIVTENTGNLEPAYAMGWLIENAVEEDNALYQIPVAKVSGLDYGVYTVTITPMYSSRMDMQKDGAYDFYVDALRIYDPAGAGDEITNPTISYAYTHDKEANPDYIELRDMLIGANKLTNDGTSAEGVIFIDGISENDDVSKYTAGGPNNELYLLKDQAVAFEIWASVIPDDVQISAKAVGTDTPEMFISYTTTAGTYTATETIRTSTDLYYSIDALLRGQSQGQLNWTPVTGADGNTYYTSGTVVIQNLTEGIISITNLKWTFPSAGIGYYENLANGGVQTVEDEPLMLMSSYSTFAMARSSLRAVNADLEITEDDIVIENDTVTAGESISIKVTTSTDVETLVIRDENGNIITPGSIESFVETIDDEDVKQWYVTLETSEAGTYSFSVTGAYENGYEASESVVITVTVENATPDTEQGSDENENESSILDTITGFFARLADFFKKIIAFITNLLS